MEKSTEFSFSLNTCLLIRGYSTVRYKRRKNGLLWKRILLEICCNFELAPQRSLEGASVAKMKKRAPRKNCRFGRTISSSIKVDLSTRRMIIALIWLENGREKCAEKRAAKIVIDPRKERERETLPEKIESSRHDTASFFARRNSKRRLFQSRRPWVHNLIWKSEENLTRAVR